jgi:hypothetical protein
MNELPFTEEELSLLTVNNVRNNKELWVRAFDYYNSDPKNRKLSMYCRPCYIKVALYISSKNKKRI